MDLTRSGSSNQKVDPSPGRLRTPMDPPMSFTSCLQMARPSPVPPYFAGVRSVHLAEPFKEQCDLLLRNPDTGVAHGDSHP